MHFKLNFVATKQDIFAPDQVRGNHIPHGDRRSSEYPSCINSQVKRPRLQHFPGNLLQSPTQAGTAVASLLICSKKKKNPGREERGRGGGEHCFLSLQSSRTHPLGVITGPTCSVGCVKVQTYRFYPAFRYI
ncbi:hypothetical protein AMECASPLE_012496 [Ameca splendens]|uniref:Uncharacterized protein n=1 Tax=Ameca splendens TaxID=208324 RepID=A0ABV0YZ25_9TELE